MYRKHWTRGHTWNIPALKRAKKEQRKVSEMGRRWQRLFSDAHGRLLGDAEWGWFLLPPALGLTCSFVLCREKEVSQGYKVSSGSRECKDLRGRRDHQDRRWAWLSWAQGLGGVDLRWSVSLLRQVVIVACLSVPGWHRRTRTAGN